MPSATKASKKGSVPHPCDFFLSYGWKSSTLSDPCPTPPPRPGKQSLGPPAPPAKSDKFILKAGCPIHRVLCDGWENIHSASVLCFVELAIRFLLEISNLHQIVCRVPHPSRALRWVGEHPLSKRSLFCLTCNSFPVEDFRFPSKSPPGSPSFSVLC